MRCYFMRNEHIVAVELLGEGISDATAVTSAKALFVGCQRERRYDGFEVWDRARRVYLWPPD
jgi:hypothetical protein